MDRLPAAAQGRTKNIGGLTMLSRLHRTDIALLVAAFVLGTSMSVAAEGPVIRRGDAFPVCLSPEALSAAKNPALDPSSGGGFWMPGPERFLGWSLRDLRAYLEKITSATHPLVMSDEQTKRG